MLMSEQIKWTDFLSAKNKVKLDSGDVKYDNTFVGIDFGTSTTVVSIASVDQKGELQVKHIPLKQKLFNGKSVTDYRVNSVVALKKNKILVGKGAKQESKLLERNVNYWQSFKMELGTDQGCAYPHSELNGDKGVLIQNPKDVTTFFFKYIKGMIDEYVRNNNLPTSIKYAVTIPASFEATQRIDLMQCLENANIGVEESCLIDEPNAAFLSYFLDNLSNESKFHLPEEHNPNVLVFDFGAGTCDISILEIGQSFKGVNTKNIAISQYAEIGGDNIDKMIATNCLLPQMLKQSKKTKKDFRDNEIKKEIIPQLIAFAEKLKIQVSDKIAVYPDILKESDEELANHRFLLDKSKRLNTRLGELHIDRPTITLLDFKEISSEFCFEADFKGVQMSINPIFSALEKAKLATNDIDYVLFIGGSSKNVIIRNQVESVFNKATILLPSDLQSHVSKGAAIQSLLMHQFDTQIIRPISNQRIFTLYKMNGQEKESTIVEAGMPVPFAEIEIDKFCPQREGQEVIEIPIYIGNQNNELEKIILTNVRGKGFSLKDKIKLSVAIDVNKIMVVKASANDKQVEIKVENPFSSSSSTLNEKEIQNALKVFNISTQKFGGRPPMKEYNKLIEVYKNHNDSLNAAELLEEAVETHNLESKFNDLNVLFAKAGKSEKSLQYSEKALKKSPNNATMLFNYAYEIRYSDQKKAISNLRKAISIEPNKANALYLLGDTLNDDEGEVLIKKSFEIWIEKFENNTMNSWDYSWFESCAKKSGKHDLARKIKQSNLDREESGFYDDENLMSGNFNEKK
jgi:molecular chaperone DnaK